MIELKSIIVTFVAFIIATGITGFLKNKRNDY
ncbi:hypothetical protein DFQ07_0415 [Tenacibaculum caenipelagi]|uniref:Uncharacterized protein n=1 Tax=Tenacibaculum caenipelagi TaxID=1325435 RepID=A0A4R6TP67_9FLAO|nr:hypothetical protein DFQ07_0415 [Tenacibaculum caenipelagi]